VINKIKLSSSQTNIRLDQYLSSKYTNLSRSKIQNLIKSGNVKIDGKCVKSSLLLKGNENIEMIYEDSIDEINILPEEIDLDIIYEDLSLIALNKPAGLVVHPGNGNHKGTLLNGLIYYYNNLLSLSNNMPGIVHRLDKNTSGVILVAKSDDAHQFISNQFMNRSVYKNYKAIVWGRIEDEGIISSKILRHPKKRSIYTTSDYNGRESITHFKLIKYYPPFSYVDLFPKTGRTHQLRVHLQSIGHPIVSDDLYGGGIILSKSFHVKYTNTINLIFKLIKRVALHAYSIKITHPEKNEIVDYIAKLPEDFKKSIKYLDDEYK
tara:strand:+ start:125 stop:1087 length:963 start_codon:yes stop_codon:yes gene_type:complete